MGGSYAGQQPTLPAFIVHWRRRQCPLHVVVVHDGGGDGSAVVIDSQILEDFGVRNVTRSDVFSLEY